MNVISCCWAQEENPHHTFGQSARIQGSKMSGTDRVFLISSICTKLFPHPALMMSPLLVRKCLQPNCQARLNRFSNKLLLVLCRFTHIHLTPAMSHEKCNCWTVALTTTSLWIIFSILLVMPLSSRSPRWTWPNASDCLYHESTHSNLSQSGLLHYRKRQEISTSKKCH